MNPDTPVSCCETLEFRGGGRCAVWRFWSILAVTATFLGTAGHSTAATPSLQDSTYRTPVPTALASSDWKAIRDTYDSNRHGVVAVGGGHRARNPGQQWQTSFDGRGFLTTPNRGGWTWGLELRSFGFEGNEQQVLGKPAVYAEGQRITYVWSSSLQEWFVNDSRGLEHGFTLNERPLSAIATARLRFGLAIRGSLCAKASRDGDEARFIDDSGSAAVIYSGLKVIDADGKNLPAYFVVSGSALHVSVDERGARYPITVDPIAQQAYVKASNPQMGDGFGRAVAISGDTVVVSATGEDSNATTINGDQSDNSASDSGAAYVFVRSGTTWTQQAYLKASNTDSQDQYGCSVAISGDTLIVGAVNEGSNATGVNGSQNNNNSLTSGAAYVYIRNGTTWTQQAYLKASNAETYDRFGVSVAIDGETIVVGAFGEDSNAVGVNGAQNNNSASNAGAAYVFVRSGTNWSQEAYLKASNADAGDFFGTSVTISGNTIAVGAHFEASNATGINGVQSNNVAGGSGAAYVFVRSGTTWTQEAYLKASNADNNDLFGLPVAISGDTLVVGAHAERGNSVGVNGNEADNSVQNAGAAYVFVRHGSTWTQQAYLKASNTGTPDDAFGDSVAISGNTIVIGAHGEDSNATGINGNETDNSAPWAGAVYVFTRTGTTWSQLAYVKASNTEQDDYFGISVAVSGSTIVVGADAEDSVSAGINGNQINGYAPASGAAYIFDTACAPGRLDTTFNPGPLVDSAVTAVVVDPNGKILIGGSFDSFNGYTAATGITRLNPNGSVDTSFNVGGTGTTGFVRDVFLQPDAKILIGGSFTAYNGYQRNGVARLNSDGSLDTNFSPATVPNEDVLAIRLQSNGDVLIGGVAISGSIKGIARLNGITGAFDATFNPGGGAGVNARVDSISVQSDDRIIIGGDFTTYNGNPCSRVARLNSDGSLDGNFLPGMGADNIVFETALEPGPPPNKVIIGGVFSHYQGVIRNRIARLLPNGNLDPAFDANAVTTGNFSSAVHAISVLSDGNVLIGGTDFSNSGPKLARLLPSGALDATFDPSPGTGADDVILDIAVQADGTVLIGGEFTAYSGTSLNRIARLCASTAPAPFMRSSRGNTVRPRTSAAVTIARFWPFVLQVQPGNPPRLRLGWRWW